MIRFPLFSLLLLALASCSAQPATEGGTPVVERVDAARFQRLIGEDEHPQVLDVRTAAETATETLPDALAIDVLQPGFIEQANRQLDPQRPVYVYCRSGNRSRQAAAQLADAGFSRVVELESGILGWKAAGLPTRGQHTAR